jgi:hypothetical protein
MSPFRHIPVILLLILLTACAPEEPEATQVPIVRVTNTAVPTTTSPTPTSAVRPPTPAPTQTAVPTQLPTTIPLPLSLLIPFPTVTPEYLLHYPSLDFLPLKENGLQFTMTLYILKYLLVQPFRIVVNIIVFTAAQFCLTKPLIIRLTSTCHPKVTCQQ